MPLWRELRELRHRYRLLALLSALLSALRLLATHAARAHVSCTDPSYLQLTMSAEVSELREALRDALDRRGVLRGLKAQLRAEVFSTLEDGDDVRPSLPHENLLINELIREYLAFNNYGHTLSVFLPEAGQPVEPLRRDFLQGQCRLPEVESTAPEAAADQALPLLYSLCAGAPTTRAPTGGAAARAAAAPPRSPRARGPPAPTGFGF